MYAAGLLWYVGSVWDTPPVGAITFAWRSWYEPLLLIVILGWATGHLRRTADRILVGALAGAYLVRSLARTFFFDGRPYFGDPAWHNPFVITWNEAAWSRVESLALWTSALVGIGVAVTCLVRWRRASSPARRTLTPVLAAGLAMVPLLGWTAFTDQFTEVQLPPEIPVFWITMALRAVVPIAVLVGIYRLETSRALAALLAELDRGVPVGKLERVIARALGDPSLRLAYARSDGTYVDEAGGHVPLPLAGPSVAVATIRSANGQPMAAILHDPALDEDPDLIAAAGAAARLDPRERATPSRGPGAARRGPGVAREAGRSVRRRAKAGGARPARRCPAAARDVVAPA